MALNPLLNRTRKSASGFTLLEVMVALAIVATALPALLTLVMSQLDGAGHVREKTYAMWIAENQLARLSMLNNKTYFPTYKLPEKDSGKVEMMGLQWEWQIDTAKDERVPILLKVEIGVAMQGLADNRMNNSKGFGDIDALANLTGYMSE